VSCSLAIHGSGLISGLVLPYGMV